MSRFLDSYSDYAINRKNLRFFTPDIALGIIDEAEKAGVKILGLDAFLIKLHFIQPWMEHSINLEKRNDGGWDVARQFLLEKKNLGFLFEIVVDEKEKGTGTNTDSK